MALTNRELSEQSFGKALEEELGPNVIDVTKAHDLARKRWIAKGRDPDKEGWSAWLCCMAEYLVEIGKKNECSKK